jgi:nucleotide-binding universal stress UspA family protein
LGSIAERVLHVAPCPVLLVRAAEPISNVLITLDGSPLAERALWPGLEVARRLGATVTLLYVVNLAVEGEGATSAQRVEAEGYLHHIVAGHPAAEADCRTVVQQGESVAATILAYAAEQGINLITMSTHGRTGLDRWRYGSVAQKVLHGWHGSMLVVRPG